MSFPLLTVTFLLLLTSTVWCKLTVAEADLASVSMEQVVAEADVLETRLQQSKDCLGVLEEVTIYEYLVDTADSSTVAVNVTVAVLQATHQVVATVTPGQSQPDVTVLRPELNCLAQDSMQLAAALLEHYLLPPPTPMSRAYHSNTSEPNQCGTSKGSQVKQDEFLDQFIFKGKTRDGFFVEAGADNFLLNSNTLLFERQYGWAGLLVEPVPSMFRLGLEAGRAVWAAPVCLGLHSKPHFASFSSSALPGQSMAGLVPGQQQGTHRAQCFPLASLLGSVGNPRVNYFSLDIEGAEFQVLQTIPWDQVDIEVMSVELHMAGVVFPGSRAQVHSYLSSKGYTYIGTLGGQDDLFVRADLLGSTYPHLPASLPKEWTCHFDYWLDKELQL